MFSSLANPIRFQGSIVISAPKQSPIVTDVFTAQVTDFPDAQVTFEQGQTAARLHRSKPTDGSIQGTVDLQKNVFSADSYTDEQLRSFCRGA